MPNFVFTAAHRKAAPRFLVSTLLGASVVFAAGCGGSSGNGNGGTRTYPILLSSDIAQFQDTESSTDTDSSGHTTTDGPTTDFITGSDIPLLSFIQSDSAITTVTPSGIEGSVQQATQNTGSGINHIYFKNDVTGLYLYGQDQADSAGNVTLTVRYRPYIYLPSASSAPAGKTFSESVIAVETPTDVTAPVYTTSYTINISSAGTESVTVPAGTFANATKLNVSTVSNRGSYADNVTVKGTSASTIWITPGLGGIKEIDSEQSKTYEYQSNTLQSSETSDSEYALTYASIDGKTFGAPIETESRSARSSSAPLHRLFSRLSRTAIKSR